MDVACPLCHQTVPADRPFCTQCGARLSNPPTQKCRAADLDRLRIDARARILWGEDRVALRTDLLKQGFSTWDVDRALDDAIEERKTHFRRLGKKDLLIGAACLGGSVLAFGAYWLFTHSRRTPVRTTGMAYLAMIALPAAAAYFFIRGGRRLLGGGQGERDASDLEEED